MAFLALLISAALKASNVPDVFSSLPGRQTMAVMVCRCGKGLPLAQCLSVDAEIFPV
jgi:hypothetical protein